MINAWVRPGIEAAMHRQLLSEGTLKNSLKTAYDLQFAIFKVNIKFEDNSVTSDQYFAHTSYAIQA